MIRSNEQLRGMLITGATGNVGSEVCRWVSAGPVPIRGAITPARLRKYGAQSPNVTAPLHGAEPCPFDFTDNTTWDAALAGVDRVLLIRPPHISNIRRDLYPFIAYMKEKEIGHVVFLSVQGAETNRIIPHHKTERAILELGLPYTFIRPSFFMQNLTTTHLPEIRDEHRIFVPAGGGVTNFIDVRDIGEAIATVLLGDDHRYRSYELTGDTSYSYYQVAERLSRILGRDITYQPASLIPFIRYQRSRGRRFGHALVMYALYTVTRLGKAGGETDTIRNLLGRPPRSLDRFIEDHKDLFSEVPRDPSSTL